MGISKATQRALRQGNPLSLYLFGICMKYIARLMQQYITWPDFHFHPKYAHLRIAHLAYADDLLLLTRGDVLSITTLITCSTQFGEMVGLRANSIKSNIYTAEVVQEDQFIAKGHSILCRGGLAHHFSAF